MRRGLYGRTSALPLSARKWCRRRLPLTDEGGIKLGLLLNNNDDDEQNGVDNRPRGGRSEASAVFQDFHGGFNALIILIPRAILPSLDNGICRLFFLYIV